MPSKVTIPPGTRFGRLTVLREDPVRPSPGKVHWICRCDCGSETSPLVSDLRSGNTRSCGRCVHPTQTTHGLSHRCSEYTTWASMLDRCRNPASTYYSRYGGRGITVCGQWQRFENFYADMGDRPSPDHSLDRIDNDGPYSPENCRWATRSEQGQNKCNNRWITYNGRTMRIAEWAEVTGIPVRAIKVRLGVHGWSLERALTQPFTPRAIHVAPSVSESAHETGTGTGTES